MVAVDCVLAGLKSMACIAERKAAQHRVSWLIICCPRNAGPRCVLCSADTIYAFWQISPKQRGRQLFPFYADARRGESFARAATRTGVVGRGSERISLQECPELTHERAAAAVVPIKSTRLAQRGSERACGPFVVNEINCLGRFVRLTTTPERT